jgi:hypothetical protein
MMTTADSYKTTPVRDLMKDAYDAAIERGLRDSEAGAEGIRVLAWLASQNDERVLIPSTESQLKEQLRKAAIEAGLIQEAHESVDVEVESE